MEGDYYKTWFYFSVTGIPQGELITFTFKNLNNQVSSLRVSNAVNQLIICFRANCTTKALNLFTESCLPNKRNGEGLWLKSLRSSTLKTSLLYLSVTCLPTLRTSQPSSPLRSHSRTRNRLNKWMSYRRNWLISRTSISIEKYFTTRWKAGRWNS